MGAPWLDGLLTALATSGAAMLLHEARAWPLLAQAWAAVIEAAPSDGLRWLWVAWACALLALARQAARTPRR